MGKKAYSFIQLSDSERDEDLVSHAIADAQVHYAFVHVFGERDDLLPGARSFEGFGQPRVVLSQISEIGDNEGQEVSSETVLSTCFKAFVFRSNLEDEFLLCLYGSLVSFKETRSRNHLFWVVSLDFGDVELFYHIDEIFGS